MKAIVIFLILSLLSFGISGLDDAYRSVFNIAKFTSDRLINADINAVIVQIVFSALAFLILSPLLLGMLEWYWNLTGGKKTGVGDIFAWYGSGKLYGKSLLLGINIGIRTLLWGILTCGVPAVLIAAASYYNNGINFEQSNLSAIEVQKLLIAGILFMLGGLLMLGGILLLIFITSKYITAMFLIVEDNSRKVSEVIKDSIKYTRKFRWEITKFILSYTGWFITCIFLVPSLYVVPYFCSSLSVFEKHIIYSQRQNKKDDDTIQFSA
jgi:uncharacterized membrane protein